MIAELSRQLEKREENQIEEEEEDAEVQDDDDDDTKTKTIGDEAGERESGTSTDIIDAQAVEVRFNLG